ncbi:SRPBCC family protein [Prosthecomicrobium hirschii]|uniref:SRPBCC family protein n=1 Tax=Prosthecodimorpha hirschii TaxID=665126 RepID=UPI00221E80E5|nr:SRPBCC family protein [Prosthecomicrobium hirschii]MCW1841520.1 SRPBCC family protein [Prosthecomicrobium hirschii]
MSLFAADLPDPNGFELSVTREIAAPRDLIFRLWTDPARIEEWWGPGGMTVPAVEMDLRPGGRFHVVSRLPDGQEYPFEGVFLEVTAPERIVFTDAFRAGWVPKPDPFTVSITTLDDLGDGRTRYTARGRHWSAAKRDEHAAMGFDDGWGRSADRLAALAERLARGGA